MKKLHYMLGIFAGVLLMPLSVQAISSPEIHPIPQAVDAYTYTISGNVDAFARVTVIGGANEIPPVEADAQGNFEIQVGLAQESLNRFLITASKDNEISPAIVVNIRESSKEAAQYQQETGNDVVAPSAPTLNPVLTPINANTVEITGTTEGDATVKVTQTNGIMITKTTANASGAFRICVPLEQNQENFFSFISVDKAGNTSVITQAKILENSNESTTVGEECNQDTQGDQAETTPSSPQAVQVITKTELRDSDFIDINGHWAEEFIEKLHGNNVVNGKTPTEFAPDANITRAELLKVGLLAFNHTVTEESGEKPFDDVAFDSWYVHFVLAGKKMEAVSGYEDNTFRPNKNVSRAEALKILLYLANIEIEDTTSSPFVDVSADAWFAPYVVVAQDLEIVGGYEDNTFRPENPITRAEVTKIVNNLLEITKEEDQNEAPEVIEESTSVNEQADEKTTTPVSVKENLQVYTNQPYAFRFQFNKNWYYATVAGEGDTIITLLLGEEDFREIENDEEVAKVKVQLVKGVSDKVDGFSQITGETYTLIKHYDENRHFVIEGNIGMTADINTIGENLETNIVVDTTAS